jgi:hypothetical protein
MFLSATHGNDARPGENPSESRLRVCHETAERTKRIRFRAEMVHGMGNCHSVTDPSMISRARSLTAAIPETLLQNRFPPRKTFVMIGDETL